jgi:hypothetical protein
MWARELHSCTSKRVSVAGDCDNVNETTINLQEELCSMKLVTLFDLVSLICLYTIECHCTQKYFRLLFLANCRITLQSVWQDTRSSLQNKRIPKYWDRKLFTRNIAQKVAWHALAWNVRKRVSYLASRLLEFRHSEETRRVERRSLALYANCWTYRNISAALP